MPILGIYASSMQPALNASSYESIATVTVGAGGSSSITFSSIPSTYKHLQVRYLSGDQRGISVSPLSLNFNSDTGSNYAFHDLEGDGSAAASYANTTQSKIWIYQGGNSTFGAGVVDILDYQNTNKYKTVRGLCGADANGSGTVWLASGLWQNTSAVSTIVLTPFSGNIRQYSSFALYGCK